MSIVIKVDNIGKKYIIDHKVGVKSYTTLRESLFNLNKPKSTAKEEFWALRNVSFEINQGDKVGIIGRNGAGKSTLLKILSRITEPTTGKIGIKGRVASLLEVGTGFHPELTGRENIFLNASILGMKYKEIKKKFDEIVEFSGVEKFLDTPVKRYSSGMYVRLAFSVAAHLETDILLVDEVLAVGDTEFQKKCLGKMDDITKSEGRTILFVSHNMATVHSFCSKAVVIENGKILYYGLLEGAVSLYYKLLNSKKDYKSLFKNYEHQIIIKDFKLEPFEKNYYTDYKFEASVIFYSSCKLPNSYINFVIEDLEGKFIFHSRTDVYEIYPSFEKSYYLIKIEIPNLNLKAGIYNFWFRIVNFNNNNLIIDSDKVPFEIEGPLVSGIISSKSIWFYEKVDLDSYKDD